MKKIISCILAVLLLSGLAAAVAAAEPASCTVLTDSVQAAAGSQVTIPIRIVDNPGFTNFGIKLDYDREHLILVGLNTSDGESTYLCGTLASTNTAWTEADGRDYGYVTCASAETVTGDGILFTATFQVCESFFGTAAVTPVVSYVRNNGAAFSVFEEIIAGVQAGEISSALLGDVNGDEKVDMGDVMLIYKFYTNTAAEPTAAQLAAADINADGRINIADVMIAYKIYKGEY